MARQFNIQEANQQAMAT